MIRLDEPPNDKDQEHHMSDDTKPQDGKAMSPASAGYGKYTRWALDATFWPQRVFVPMADDDSLILGMNLMTDLPPGKLAAIIHAEGQDAVDSFVDDHADELEKMLGKHP